MTEYTITKMRQLLETDREERGAERKGYKDPSQFFKKIMMQLRRADTPGRLTIEDWGVLIQQAWLHHHYVYIVIPKSRYIVAGAGVHRLGFILDYQDRRPLSSIGTVHGHRWQEGDRWRSAVLTQRHIHRNMTKMVISSHDYTKVNDDAVVDGLGIRDFL